MDETQQEDLSKLDKLVNALEETNKHMRRIYSWKWMLIRGMSYGVGMIIGASILAGLGLSVIVPLFENAPLAGEFFQSIMDKTR